MSFHFKAARPSELRHRLEFPFNHSQEAKALAPIHDQVSYLLKAYDAELALDAEESSGWCLSLQTPN